MSTPSPEGAGGTPAVPTPAEAVASGQIPATFQPAAPAAPPATPPAGQQPAPGAQGDDKGKPAAPTDWESEATKWRALARQHENKHLSALGFKSKDEIDELRQAAQKYAEFEDAQKSEIQKANEKAQSVQQQLEQERTTNARLMAAAAHGIPPELIGSIGGSTPDEINANAEALAKYVEAKTAASGAAAPVAPQRPVESLTPGAAPASSSGEASPDQWIRRMAGRST